MLDENLQRKFPELTKLKTNKVYEAVQTYPHEGAVLGIKINNYIQHKDFPSHIRNVVNEALEENENTYMKEIYDPILISIIPFAIGTGSDGYHYVMIPYNENESEAISVDCERQKYLDIKL